METTIRTRKLWVATLGALAIICLCFGLLCNGGGVAASESAAPAGMKSVIDSTSVGALKWGNATGTAFSYDENGGNFTLGDVNVVACGTVSLNQTAAPGATVLRFNTQLSETEQYEWNHIVFRGDPGMNDFIALAFRKGGGHISILSRVKDTWYSFAESGAVTGINTVKAYDLGTSSLLSGLEQGATVAVEIYSTETNVKVSVNGEEIWTSALAHRLPAAAGIFAYGSASSNSKAAMTNLYGYGEDYTAWNNGVKADSSLAYTWDAGGIRNVTYAPASGETGATLGGNSGVTGGRMFIENGYTGQTVHTFTASMPSSATDEKYQWNIFLFRADPESGSCIGFAFRSFAQATVFVYNNTTKQDTWDFCDDLTFLNAQDKTYQAATFDPITKDTVDVTIVSDEEHMTAYIDGVLVYNADLYLSLPAASGLTMFTHMGTNMNAQYTDIKCYDGNVKIDLNAAGKTYDGSPVVASVASASQKGVTYDSSKIKLEYKAEGAEDSAYAAAAPSAAGSYVVRATVDAAQDAENYGTATAKFQIAKANYSSAPAHDALTGAYDPAKTLANYTLTQGYRWADDTVVPTVGQTSYAALYNADSANYNDFATQISLTLSKIDPVVTLPAASDVVRGNALSTSSLSGGTGATFAFKDGTTVMNTLGAQQVTVVCTPADTENYNVIERTITVTVVKNDADYAADVQAMIDALPDTIALTDEEDVIAARNAYNALTDTQKALVNVDKLTAAEQAIVAFKDAAAAKTVSDMIDALPDTIALTDEEDVVAARTAYDNLTAAQKALVTNLDDLTAAEQAIVALKNAAAAKTVSDMISALPDTVALTDETAIVAARTAYDSLTAAQKALVTNLDDLTDAEEALAALKNAADDPEEDKKGCGKSAATAGASAMAVALLTAGVALIKKK